MRVHQPRQQRAAAAMDDLGPVGPLPGRGDRDDPPSGHPHVARGPVRLDDDVTQQRVRAVIRFFHPNPLSTSAQPTDHPPPLLNRLHGYVPTPSSREPSRMNEPAVAMVAAAADA